MLEVMYRVSGSPVPPGSASCGDLVQLVITSTYEWNCLCVRNAIYEVDQTGSRYPSPCPCSLSSVELLFFGMMH